MGDDHVKVVLESLDQAIAQLASFDSEIEQQLAELQNRLAELHTRWEGDAAAAHAHAQAEWAEGARMLSEGIKGMHRASVEAHSSFRSAIIANRARFS
ncbi:WXG100 family type VII secretion target [Mycolicibacterium mageritense]|uniref:WXG100 family type VII secretion target n=1 Tax=Mycolicibacterium mageritense TaxID=53462 RepID=UPI0011D4127A|nr:WXG100 family type VII secretion target [Mycolicibacterium mageritense]TXI53373.1 MAG: WXG100 family type VII secretion target [Mycolicibacterium mageritense]